MTINQIIKTPLNTNYVGGAQKNKNNIRMNLKLFLKNAKKLQYV